MAAPVVAAAAKVAVKTGIAKHSSKIVAAVVAILVALILSPVFAIAGMGALAAQAFEESQNTSSIYDVSDIGGCAPGCPGVDGPQSGISVKTVIAVALSEVGTSRKTGYNMPGECIVSVRRWLHAGGGFFSGGDVVSGYAASPAIRILDGSLRPGDVIQYTNNTHPTVFAPGVHTYLVIQVHADGTHDLVESNNPGGSGRVVMRTHVKAEPPQGWHARVYRFAETVDL